MRVLKCEFCENRGFQNAIFLDLSVDFWLCVVFQNLELFQCHSFLVPIPG